MQWQAQQSFRSSLIWIISLLRQICPDAQILLQESPRSLNAAHPRNQDVIDKTERNVFDNKKKNHTYAEEMYMYIYIYRMHNFFVLTNGFYLKQIFYKQFCSVKFTLIVLEFCITGSLQRHFMLGVCCRFHILRNFRDRGQVLSSAIIGKLRQLSEHRLRQQAETEKISRQLQKWTIFLLVSRVRKFSHTMHFTALTVKFLMNVVDGFLTTASILLSTTSSVLL